MALVAPLLSGRTRVVITHDVEHGLADADLVLGLRAGPRRAAGRATPSEADVRALYA